MQDALADAIASKDYAKAAEIQSLQDALWTYIFEYFDIILIRTSIHIIILCNEKKK